MPNSISDDRLTFEALTPVYTGKSATGRFEVVVEREAGKPLARTAVLDGDYLRIGSHPSNNLVIDDPQVSRFHCRITRDEKGWRLHDSGSLNGTTLAGLRVQDAFIPEAGGIVEIGGSVLRLKGKPSAASVDLTEAARLGHLHGGSVPMRRLFALVERVAASDSNVLIEGESGTGKELVASEIVRAGNRAKKPFVIVDCSAISPNLIESELFGHTRGAFTGADRDRIGAFEAAQGGTVFLDEIGEMPLEMQPKLLRALEAREIRRIGEASTRKVDVRVIAATNRRLEREVNQGRFREDLYFRLSVVTLRVPPLRERIEDLPLLVRNFLEVLGANESAHLFTKDVLDDLSRHEWPGNVRELRNFVERTVVLQTTSPTYSDAPFGNRTPSQPPRAESAGPQPVDLAVSFREAKERTIADFERRYIGSLLDWSDGNISRAARKAQMDRMNLYRLIQRYGLRDTRVLDRDEKE